MGRAETVEDKPEAAGVPRDTVELAPGVELRCAVHNRDGAVEVSLLHKAEHLAAAILHHGAGPHRFGISTRHLTAYVQVTVDHTRGEIHALGELGLAGERVKLDHTVRYSPCSGSVGRDLIPHPPVLRSRRFGVTRPYTSHVTRIFVDDEPSLLTHVGRRVKRCMWEDTAPWVFNTVSCVGVDQPHDEHPGYTDPTSQWFNVFVGYYQIDVDKREWRRPFGYRSARGVGSEIEHEDLARLGRSDWNWFANWMYGVPEELVTTYCGTGLQGLECRQSSPVIVGERLWHVAGVDNLEFVSAYESDAPGAGKLCHNSLLTFAWRRCYGPPNPHPDFPKSFIPTVMSTRLYASYWEDDEQFHTVMFGAAARRDQDEKFLEVQLGAVRHVIETAYPELGFGAGPSRQTTLPASPAAAPD